MEIQEKGGIIALNQEKDQNIFCDGPYSDLVDFLRQDLIEPEKGLTEKEAKALAYVVFHPHKSLKHIVQQMPVFYQDPPRRRLTGRILNELVETGILRKYVNLRATRQNLYVV